MLDEFTREVKTNPAIFVGPYAAVAIPARLALERGDWSAAARLPQQNTRFAFCEAITTFTRVLGAARMGDVAAAEQEAQRLEAQHKSLVEAKNSYWAHPGRRFNALLLRLGLHVRAGRTTSRYA